jgi:hypothetical protein
MRAIYDHLLDDYETGISCSSEATNHNCELLLNPLLFKTWYSTGITSEWIKFDSGSSGGFTFDCCALSNHNFTASVVAKFQMHDTDDWSNPDLNETITYRAGHMIRFFTSTSKRYCRFYFEDTTNTSTYLQIGRLTASNYLQFTPSSLAEFKIIENRTDIVNITPSNNCYGYQLSDFRTFEYEFPKSASSMISSIKDIYDTNGKVIPWYFMNFDTAWTVIEPAYVILTNDFEQGWKEGKASYGLRLREVGGY